MWHIVCVAASVMQHLWRSVCVAVPFGTASATQCLWCSASAAAYDLRRAYEAARFDVAFVMQCRSRSACGAAPVAHRLCGTHCMWHKDGNYRGNLPAAQRLWCSVRDAASVEQCLRRSVYDSAPVMHHMRRSVCNAAHVAHRLCGSVCHAALVAQRLCRSALWHMHGGLWRSAYGVAPVAQRPFCSALGVAPFLQRPWRSTLGAAPMAQRPWRSAHGAAPLAQRPWRSALGAAPVAHRPWHSACAAAPVPQRLYRSACTAACVPQRLYRSACSEACDAVSMAQCLWP